MEIKIIEMDDSYTHLALVGRLDVIGAGEIENKFIGFSAARKKNTVADLAEVSFLGSMGIRIFMSTAKALGLEGKKLILVNPQPEVSKVLEVSGILTFIPLAADTAAAVALTKS